jgi:hypothetical protein
MKIEASEVGPSQSDWVWKNEPGSKVTRTFGASTAN